MYSCPDPQGKDLRKQNLLFQNLRLQDLQL